MTEADRFRIAAMLAADAEFDVRTRFAAALDGDVDHRANAFLIDCHEGIARDQALVHILGQERRGVVARHAQRGLGEIVGAEVIDPLRHVETPAMLQCFMTVGVLGLAREFNRRHGLSVPRFLQLSANL